MTLRVTFLGTSGSVPSPERNPSAVLVNREGELLLFDVGEGTQRQMMRFGTGFSVSRIFVSHVHADHVLGLPGLVLTMAFNGRTEPLSIHTPTGTGSNLRRLLDALDDRPPFPIEITEVAPDQVAYRADDFEVRTFRTAHRTRSVGYALVEDERRGRFDRERAEELGVPVGPLFTTLHEGEPVELEDGSIVRPEQVVGDSRPGRTVVYTGDTRPTAETVEVADGADLLVHDATFASDLADRARETAHATAAEAAEIAERAGATRLALTHVSSRYAADASVLEREAAGRFDGEVLVPDDGVCIDVPLPG